MKLQMTLTVPTSIEILASTHEVYTQPHNRPLQFYATHSDVTFGNAEDDDITSAAGTVTCANSSYSTALLNCSSGCTGSYAIPSDCKICSADSGTTCSTCPKATYGGSEAEIACQLCTYRYTTIYPPSSTSSADCIPITEPPTTSPTARPTVTPTQEPTAVPTDVRTSPNPWHLDCISIIHSRLVHRRTPTATTGPDAAAYRVTHAVPNQAADKGPDGPADQSACLSSGRYHQSPGI